MALPHAPTPPPRFLPHFFAPLALLLSDSGGDQRHLLPRFLLPSLHHHHHTCKRGRLRGSIRHQCHSGNFSAEKWGHVQTTPPSQLLKKRQLKKISSWPTPSQLPVHGLSPLS